MLNEYKKELEKFRLSLERTIASIRDRRDNITDEDEESLKTKKSLELEEEALLIQIDQTKDLEKDLEDLFEEIEKANKKIKVIKGTLMADEDDEDVISALDKTIHAYEAKIDKLNKKIEEKMPILERMKKFNNIDIKVNYDLKEVKEEKKARKLELTKEQFDHINTAVNNPRIFNRVAEAQGISIKSRSKAVKEEKEALRKEVFDKLEDLQKGKDDLIDIKKVLTNLYGADFTRKKKKIEDNSNVVEENKITPILDKNGKEEVVDEKIELNSKDDKNNDIYVPVNIDKMLSDALKGLDLTYKKDDKKYKRIQYKCRESFKEKVHTGNYVKNIFSVLRSGVVAAGMWFGKKKAQLTTTEEDKERYKELKRRIDNWSDDELVAFVKAYKGNEALSKDKPKIFNTVLDQRYSEYVNKKVQKINEEIIDIHNKVYDAYGLVKYFDKKLEKEDLTKKEKNEILAKKKLVLDGKAKLIGRYYELKDEGNRLFIGEGLHDVSETNKAIYHRGSKIGGRLAKGYDEDEELSKEESNLSDEIITSLKNADNEEAVRKFVEYEQLQIKNTKIERTALGTRSVGKRYYDPLVMNLDYTEDTLVRDIIMTAGAVLTVWNVGRAVANSVATSKNIAAHNHDVDVINGKNKDSMDYVNQVAHDVAKTRGKIQKGIKAEAHSDLVNGFNIRERASLDQSDWNIGSAIYHNSDHANHGLMEQLGSDLAKELKNIQHAAKGSKTVDPSLFTSLAHKYNNSFADAINDSLNIAKSYAEKHPNIELSSYLDSMIYLKHHVKDIANMSSISLKNTYAVEALQNLSIENVNAISGISDNLKEVLIQTGITGTMIVNSAVKGNALSAKYADYGYGNEAIRRIEESLPVEDRVSYDKDDIEEHDDKILEDDSKFGPKNQESRIDSSTAKTNDSIASVDSEKDFNMDKKIKQDNKSAINESMENKDSIDDESKSKENKVESVTKKEQIKKGLKKLRDMIIVPMEDEEYDDNYDSEVETNDKSVSRKGQIKKSLNRVKDNIDNSSNVFDNVIGLSNIDVIDNKNDKKKKEDNPKNSQLEALKRQKEDLKNSKKSKEEKDNNVNFVESTIIDQFRTLNNDSNISALSNGKENVLFIGDDIENLQLPKGFYINEEGLLTNKGNTDGDDYLEFKLCKYDEKVRGPLFKESNDKNKKI